MPGILKGDSGHLYVFWVAGSLTREARKLRLIANP